MKISLVNREKQLLNLGIMPNRGTQSYVFDDGSFNMVITEEFVQSCKTIKWREFIKMLKTQLEDHEQYTE